MAGKTIPQLLPELTTFEDNTQIIVRNPDNPSVKTHFGRMSTLKNYVSDIVSEAAGYATAAMEVASNAATSESNASDSASAAQASETAAAASEANAAASESAAGTSATNAAASETAAAASASAADTSETNAAGSATAAAGSATAAAASSTAAGTSETNAAASATAAATSATNAANSASAASTSETNAAGSASAAATSATNAATSETNAGTSATNAAASAAQFTGTSTTSVTPATGSQSFITQSGKNFDVGTYVQIVSGAAPSTTWMHGQVTAYSGSALTVNVDAAAGSGAHTDWTIFARSGPQGAPSAGTGDFVGAASSVSGNFVSFGDTTGKLGADSGKSASSFIASSALDTDGTLAANSDSKVASQKAAKTYADTKLPSSYLDADGTLAANSDAKIASQKAVKAYADTKSAITRSVNAQTGTTYTLVLGDAGGLVTLSNASAITLTIPPNSSVAFPTNTQIDLAALGAGQVTVAAGSGVTINSEDAKLKLNKQYSGGTLVKTATDTWLLVGSLA